MSTRTRAAPIRLVLVSSPYVPSTRAMTVRSQQRDDVRIVSFSTYASIPSFDSRTGHGQHVVPESSARHHSSASCTVVLCLHARPSSLPFVADFWEIHFSPSANVVIAAQNACAPNHRQRTPFFVDISLAASSPTVVHASPIYVSPLMRAVITYATTNPRLRDHRPRSLRVLRTHTVLDVRMTEHLFMDRIYLCRQAKPRSQHEHV